MEYSNVKESILKTSPIPYLFVKTHEASSDDYSFIIEDSSEKIYEIFGKTKSEVLGSYIHELFELKDLDKLRKYIEDGETISLYIPSLDCMSKLVPNQINKGEYVIWLSDINDTIENEECQKVKTEFFANLSHELRTPLNIIFSSLQVLNLKVSEISQQSQQDVICKYTNIATQNTYRLLKLVNNLIDSNKITSGYFDYNPQNYDIVFFIESICQSIVEFAKSKNIEIIFDTDIEEKIVSFDLDKMERIILNILSNAIKFSKDNGKIEIYIKEINDMIEIKISDNGIGIPKDKLDCIFDRFKQVDNKCVRQGEGSGIGLYLVKSLVDMHKGSIEVDSELDNGTEFTIKIPDIVEDKNMWTIMDKNLQESYIEKIKVEFSDIYA